MKVLSYGIGKKYYGGKYSEGTLLSVEVLAAFPPAQQSIVIICKKRYHAKNGYIVDYGWQKTFKDENNKLLTIKGLIDKIKSENDLTEKIAYGPNKNCGHYIITNDEKFYLNANETWQELATVLELNKFAQEDVIESLNKINADN